jgi:hypothetical protein
MSFLVVSLSFLQYQQDARKLFATVRGALELPGIEQPGQSLERITRELRAFSTAT